MAKITFDPTDTEAVCDCCNATIEKPGIPGIFPAEALVPASQLCLLIAAGIAFLTEDNNF